MPTNKDEAVCKQKQTNKQAVNLLLFSIFWIFLKLLCLIQLCFKLSPPAALQYDRRRAQLQPLWRARRHTWRCHWLQSPPYLGLTSLHHIILQVQLVKPQLLISGTFCLLFTVFSSSSENIWILLPFRSNLALQALTFVRLSMAAIQSECFSRGLHSQNFGQ